MTHGNDSKKNFEVYTPEEFIAAHGIFLNILASGYRDLPGARPAKMSLMKMARQSMNPLSLH